MLLTYKFEKSLLFIRIGSNNFTLLLLLDMKRLGFTSIALSMLLLAGCGMQSAPEVQSTLQDQISLYCLDHEGNLEMREEG